MQQRHEIHVIGGGLAGLTAAAYVARAGQPVVVHETRNRLGGRATTDERDGFRFNQGPHALYRGGAGARVLDELGVAVRGSVPAIEGITVRDGRCFVAPAGPTTLLRTRLLGFREKVELAKLLATLPRRRSADLADVTVSEWVDNEIRHEAVRDVVHMLVRLGTYVNAPDALSAQVAVQQTQLALRDGVTYLDQGWSQLIEALASTPGVRIETGTPIDELPDAAAVVVAAGGPAAARALTGHDFTIGQPAEVACLDLGLAGDPPHSIALGIDEPIYLSEHSIAAGHAPEGHSSVVLAEYLADGADPDRARLEAFARTSGISDDRIVASRYLHRMVAVSAIPTAAHGGLAGRPPVAVPGRPDVFVAGDWVGPTGHLADAVLASARTAALAAVAHVERRPVVG